MGWEGDGAGCRRGHCRLTPEWQRLGEVLLAVHERGPSRAHLLDHDGAEHLRLAGDLHDGCAGYAEHAGPRQRVHRHEQRAVDAAEGLARVVDARAVEIGLAVAVHVHAAANGPDELHQIGHGLAQTVTTGDESQRPAHRRGHALRAADTPVAVQVEPAAARGEHQRLLAALLDGERAVRPSAVADHVDGHGGEATTREGARDEWGDQILVVTEAVTEDDDGPAWRGHRAPGKEEHRLDPLVAEDRGSPGAGRARDVARAREERRALEGAQGDRADIV